MSKETARRAAIACALALGAGAAAMPVLYPALAAPLTVATPLTGADAIVVLGGGVNGEGKPTASTRERVLYAVGLYREGFAPRLILSTGAPDGISEARAMERLALELGVPREAILLEEESLNTAENVRFVSRLLRERGWERSIWVSSPYHMRRIKLVQSRCEQYRAPLSVSGTGYHVMYAPVRPSWFHEPSSLRDRLWQSWAVLHEYAGIAWYWLVVK